MERVDATHRFVKGDLAGPVNWTPVRVGVRYESGVTSGRVMRAWSHDIGPPPSAV
jgi:hypothetical protein